MTKLSIRGPNGNMLAVAGDAFGISSFCISGPRDITFSFEVLTSVEKNSKAMTHSPPKQVYYVVSYGYLHVYLTHEVTYVYVFGLMRFSVSCSHLHLKIEVMKYRFLYTIVMWKRNALDCVKEDFTVSVLCLAL
jgi:hypothetical protein